MPTDYQPGDRIPGTEPYCVVELRVAAGGHGTLYRVRHQYLHAKRAALKLLHTELTNRADLAKRMEREAQALAAMDHENIVAIYHAGITTESAPRPFYVMEYLRGTSLREGLAHAPRGLGFNTTFHTAIGVADALTCAHEKHGIIHRDIKPDNIFLHVSPKHEAVAKLLDFGVMHVLSLDKRNSEKHFIGTPLYCAPEQLLGRVPTPQTDLYSFGCVLFEMLTGKPPFQGTTLAELGEAHLKHEPPELAIFPRPEALVRLMTMLLQKDPDRRPKSALWVATELREIRRALDHEYGRALDDGAKTDETPLEGLLTSTFATDPDGVLISPEGLPHAEAEGARTDRSTGGLIGRGPAGTLENAHAPVFTTLQSGMKARSAIAAHESKGIDRHAPTHSAELTLPVKTEELLDGSVPRAPDSKEWLDIEGGEARRVRPAAGLSANTTSSAVAASVKETAAPFKRKSRAIVAMVGIAAMILLVGGWRLSHGAPNPTSAATTPPPPASPKIAVAEPVHAQSGGQLGPAPIASAIDGGANADTTPAASASSVAPPRATTAKPARRASPPAAIERDDDLVRTLDPNRLVAPAPTGSSRAPSVPGPGF